MVVAGSLDLIESLDWVTAAAEVATENAILRLEAGVLAAAMPVVLALRYAYLTEKAEVAAWAVTLADLLANW